MQSSEVIYAQRKLEHEKGWRVIEKDRESQKMIEEH